jgi:hypothetical protein
MTGRFDLLGLRGVSLPSTASISMSSEAVEASASDSRDVFEGAELAPESVSARTGAFPFVFLPERRSSVTEGVAGRVSGQMGSMQTLLTFVGFVLHAT